MEMKSIYAWTEEGPEGGEGIIVAFIPALECNLPLQNRNRAVTERMAPIARGHQRSTGHRVRLVRFDRTETLLELE